jgi:cytochrome c
MMDSFEFNKIAGAVLSVLLFVMGLGIFSSAIFHAQQPKTPGYDLPSAEVAAAAAPAAPAAAPVAQILASADPAKGAGLTKAACGACHNFEQGSGSKAGPTLYDIVNRPIASTASFAYSSSLQEKAKAPILPNQLSANIEPTLMGSPQYTRTSCTNSYQCRWFRLVHPEGVGM